MGRANPNIDWNAVDKTKMFDLELEMVAWGKTKRDKLLRLIASIPRKPQSKTHSRRLSEKRKTMIVV